MSKAFRRSYSVIAFHPQFVPAFGSIEAALFLSQAIYWTTRARDTDGWFWKTAIDWQAETGLTKGQQIRARKKLKTVIEERVAGMPQKCHFRVNMDRVEQILNGDYEDIPNRSETEQLGDEGTETVPMQAQKESTAVAKRDDLIRKTTQEITTNTTHAKGNQDLFSDSTATLQAASPPDIPKGKISKTRFIASVFDDWRRILKHPNAVMDSKRRACIEKALKNFEPAQLQQAFKGCTLSPYHMGDNERGLRYDDITLILRDAEHTERFIGYALRPPKPKPQAPRNGHDSNAPDIEPLTLS